MGACCLTVMKGARVSGLVAPGLLAFLVIGLLLCGSTPARAASGWLAPVDLTAPDGHTRRFGALAMSPTGDAAIAWLDGPAEQDAMVEVRVRPAGGEFGPAVPLPGPGPGIGIGDPSVAMSASGETLVVWSRSGDAAGVWVARRSPGGSFARPVDISGHEDISGINLAMNRRGDAVVVWTAKEGPPNASRDVVRAATRPAGGDFAPPVTLDAYTSANWTEARGAIDDAGGIVVVWSSYDRGVRAALRQPGGSFTSPILLAEDGWSSALAMNGAGATVVAWVVNQSPPAPGVRGIKFVTRPANGSFGAPMNVEGVNWTEGVDGAAMSETGLTRLLWTNQDLELRTASSPLGGPPSPATLLFTSACDDMGGSLAMARDGTTIVTTGGVTGLDCRDHAMAFVWQVGQAAPSPARSVCYGPNGDAGSTQPVLDDTGDGMVVCLRSDSQFQYAAYDASGPQLRSLSVPDSATAGSPLAVSVVPVDVWAGVAYVVWEFGDGHQAVGSSAVNTYADPGRYTVKITAIDRFENRTSTTRVVEVSKPNTKPGGVEVTKPNTKPGRRHRDAVIAAPRTSRALTPGTKGRIVLTGVTVQCPADSSRSCPATVEITTANKIRLGRRRARTVRLARTRFEVRAGRRSRVAVGLSHNGLATLRRLRGVRVRIAIAARSSSGRLTRKTLGATLKAPPSHRRAHHSGA